MKLDPSDAESTRIPVNSDHIPDQLGGIPHADVAVAEASSDEPKRELLRDGSKLAP